VKKNFSLPIKYEQETFADERFLKLKIYVMHEGKNLNNSNFSMEAIESAKDTIKNIPILAFVKESDGEDQKDFAGHEMELIFKDDQFKFKYLGRPIGVIPAEDNNYHYETIDDKNYVVVDGYVWKDYANDALDIIERDGVKSQSMEISLNAYEYDDEGICDITGYKYTGVCLLGDDVLPAMVNAKAEVMSFSADNMKEVISNMLNELHFSINDDKKSYSINNSIELANLNGKWYSINKTALREKIMNASNSKSLIEEAYLIVDEENDLYSYPHHQLKGDKLILHKAGLEATFSRLMTKDPNNSAAIDHLKRHYEELGLDTYIFEKGGKEMDKGNEFEEKKDDMPMDKEEMDDMMGDKKETEEVKDMPLDKDMMEVEDKEDKPSTFSFTSEQLEQELSRLLEQEKMEDNWGWECSCYFYVDHMPDQSIVIAYDCEDRYLVGFNYTINGDAVTVDMESKKRFKVDYVPMQVELEDDDKKEFSFVPSAIHEHYRNEMKEHETIKSKFSQLETEVTELREFKSNKLQEERSIAEEEIFDKFSSELTEDEMKPIKDKSSDYSLDQLEDKLFALAGRKKVKFSATPAVKRIKMGVFEEIKDSNVEKDVWAEQKEKFGSNK
jgi:lipocalin